MRSKQIFTKRTFVLRLERGEEILSALANFCNENKIKGGLIQGIGALSYARLYAVKNSEEFETREDEFQEPIELVSCLGNISTTGKEPLIHLHVCLGSQDKSSKIGHLLEGKISFTGEFFIQETEKIEKIKQGDLFLFKL